MVWECVRALQGLGKGCDQGSLGRSHQPTHRLPWRITKLLLVPEEERGGLAGR